MPPQEQRVVGTYAKRRSARGGGNDRPSRFRLQPANTHSSPMLHTSAHFAVDDEDAEQSGLRDSQLTRHELSDLLQNLEQHVNSLDLTNTTSGRRSEGDRHSSAAADQQRWHRRMGPV